MRLNFEIDLVLYLDNFFLDFSFRENRFRIESEPKYEKKNFFCFQFISSVWFDFGAKNNIESVFAGFEDDTKKMEERQTKLMWKRERDIYRERERERERE